MRTVLGLPRILKPHFILTKYLYSLLNKRLTSGSGSKKGLDILPTNV